LIGMMGCGKSEVGRLLAERLACEFVDLDELVEAEAGSSVAGIFAAEGEAGFRRREAAAVRAVAGRAAGVVACGGGVVLDPANVEELRRRATVVWLQVTPAVAARRLGGDAGRPVLSAMEGPLEQRLARLAADREEAYRHAAHLAVDATGSPGDVAGAVLGRLAAGRATAAAPSGPGGRGR
jgi:shikimate kinase